jgi:hypothetical protein
VLIVVGEFSPSGRHSVTVKPNLKPTLCVEHRACAAVPSRVDQSTRRRAWMYTHAVAMLVTTASMAAAAQSIQATPSWGTAPQPSPTPRAAVSTAPRLINPEAAAVAPPTPRDCHKVVTQADPNYTRDYFHAETNGYTSGSNVDLGYVLNNVRGVANDNHSDHNDLQIRVEQLRCETQNIEAKLDYIIRRMP